MRSINGSRNVAALSAATGEVLPPEMTAAGVRAKRALDFVLVVLGLLVAAPFLAIVAILIKLDSPGPVFFRQARVGRNGRTFRIFKFRTMLDGAYKMGSRLTVKRDPRITRLGRILRWSKVDELPQLFNVLAGDMSLIGPRPEDPHFVAFYDAEQRGVLAVRPGLVGPSQIEGRDEVEDYPDGLKDTESYYVEHILPAKLARDLEYVRTATFLGDVQFLLHGMWITVRGIFKFKYFWERRRRLALLGSDLLLSLASYGAALMIRFDGRFPQAEYPLQTLAVIALLRPPLLAYFGAYQGIVSFFGLWDMVRIFRGVTMSSIAVVGTSYLIGAVGHPRSVFVMDWGILLVMLCASRYLLRAWLRRHPRHRRQGRERIIVAGAGRGGEQICRALQEDPASLFEPIGFIDEVAERWGARIHGIKVLGGPAELKLALAAKRVGAVFVCLSDMTETSAREVADICAAADVECRIVPALSELLRTQVFEIDRPPKVEGTAEAVRAQA